MSRNKVVLLIAALAILYLTLPSTGTGGLVKYYMVTIIPYILIFLIVWLLVTINLLKKAMIRLSGDITDRNTLAVAKLLRMTFDVKRFMGEGNLVDLYKRVNFSKYVSMENKTLFYEALKRKRVEVPPPSTGKGASNPSTGKSKNKKKKR